MDNLSSLGNNLPICCLLYDPSSANDDFHARDFSTKLTDEELFKKCGGRTAHKGARSSMPGKLKRASAIGLGLPAIQQENGSDCEDESLTQTTDVKQIYSNENGKEKIYEEKSSTVLPAVIENDDNSKMHSGPDSDEKKVKRKEKKDRKDGDKKEKKRKRKDKDRKEKRKKRNNDETKKKADE